MNKSKKWIIKIIAQKIISFFPFNNIINYYLSRTFGWLRDDRMEERSKQQVKTPFKMLKILNSMGFGIKDKNIIELGTGWNGMFPLLLHQYSPKK